MPRSLEARTTRTDDKPVPLATSHLSAALVAGSAIHPGGHREGGGRPARRTRPGGASEEIRSRMPSGDEASQLSMAAGTPVLLVCRTAFTNEGRAVEVSEMTLDAASYILEYGFDA
ncbi:UTRA domain-containing protein [Streptomyces sp. NPDC054808]